MANNLEKSGAYFGVLTSVMTILSFILGIIGSGRLDRVEIISSIMAMAVSDSMADAYGVYVSNRTNGTNVTQRDAIIGAIYTLISKVIIQLSFIIPFFFLDKANGIAISCSIWGIGILIILSKYLAEGERNSWSHESFKVVMITLITTFLSIISTKWIMSIKHHFK